MKNEKILGVVIPYYVNDQVCISAFLGLMQKIKKQLTDEMILIVIEDGQYSNWLDEYIKEDNITVVRLSKNYGVSVARNIGINLLINDYDYILFLDSDDVISDDYLTYMLEACRKHEYDVYESQCRIVWEHVIPFREKVNRYGVVGSAISSKIIEYKRFDPNVQIAEDTEFMKSVVKLDKHTKGYVKEAIYYYQLGLNKKSLTMLHQRGLISERR